LTGGNRLASIVLGMADGMADGVRLVPGFPCCPNFSRDFPDKPLKVFFQPFYIFAAGIVYVYPYAYHRNSLTFGGEKTGPAPRQFIVPVSGNGYDADTGGCFFRRSQAGPGNPQGRSADMMAAAADNDIYIFFTENNYCLQTV
jgi:hypothetical protein